MTCNGGWQFETEAVAMKKKAIRSAELVLSFAIAIGEVNTNCVLYEKERVYFLLDGDFLRCYFALYI